MPLVRYIGRKERKTDNVAGSGTVWNGAGDVQRVSDEAWAKLKAYDTVWEQVAEDEGSGLSSVCVLPDGFDAWADEQVRAWLEGKPFKVHHKKTGESLKAAVREALGV